MATDYKVGDKIVLFKKHQEAIIRYIGKAHFAPDKTSYGLELLEDGIGDTNGTVDDQKYFECPEKKGLFVWETDIKFKIQKRKKSMKSNRKIHRKESSNIYDAVFPEPTKPPTLTDKNSSSIFSKRAKARKLGPRDVGRNDAYYGMDDELGLNNGSSNPVKKKKKKKTKRKKKDDEARVSLKKLGPRDVGRNDNYNGIAFELDEDGNKVISGSIKRKQSMKREKVMLTRKKKKKTKKRKGKKKKKSKNGITSNGKENVSTQDQDQDQGNDSDSFKSGYSGHSGYSGDSVGSPAGVDINDGNDDEIESDKDYEGTGSEDSNDTEEEEDSGDTEEEEEDDSGDIVDVQDYEQEVNEEPDLIQKAMAMMKQKQEEKEKEEALKKEEEERLAAERAAEEDKIGMVALTHKQMNENNEFLSLSANEDADGDDHEEQPQQEQDQNQDENVDEALNEDLNVKKEKENENEDENENVNDTETLQKNTNDNEDENEEIDDDLPPPNRDNLTLEQQSSSKKMLSYSKRKNSEYDTANEEPEEQDKDEDKDTEQLPLKPESKPRSPSAEELDAMRMSSIYKRISQKSLDLEKFNETKKTKDNEYDAVSTKEDEDIDKFKNEIKKADDAQRTSTIDNESDALQPKQANQGQTNNVDDVPPNVKEAQKGGCCVIL